MSAGGAPVRIGTRGSSLAMAQSALVGAAVSAVAGRPFELVAVRTQGDVDRGPLAQIGGTGVFVTAVREAVVDGRVDLAVHSFKDLPTAPDPRVALAVVPRRESPSDVLCAARGRTLATLPEASRVGTGSPRRAAQLLRLRHDLRIVPIRGNADTRLRAVDRGEVDAVVLARAGLARLGRLDAVTEEFDPDDMLPAPAQGALAVECRSDDTSLLRQLAPLDDVDTRRAATAERMVLARLGSGCAAPVGALAVVAGDRLRLRARVIAPGGTDLCEAEVAGPAAAAVELGAAGAAELLRRGAAGLMQVGS